VLPVAAADALAWARGQLDDRDLLLRAPLKPEAVFIVSMPGRVGYRQTAERVLHWARRGAVCLIARTANPIVAHHMEANGFIPGACEGRGGLGSQVRYFAPPAAFAKWCAKVARPLAPDPALAAGTPAQTRRCEIQTPPMSGHRAPDQNAS
jgi:hypothetical protein